MEQQLWAGEETWNYPVQFAPRDDRGNSGNSNHMPRNTSRRAAKNQNACACGHCSRCLDNARWERIFAEKFADPDYYAPRSTRLVSRH